MDQGLLQHVWPRPFAAPRVEAAFRRHQAWAHVLTHHCFAVVYMLSMCIFLVYFDILGPLRADRAERISVRAVATGFGLTHAMLPIWLLYHPRQTCAYMLAQFVFFTMEGVLLQLRVSLEPDYQAYLRMSGLWQYSFRVLYIVVGGFSMVQCVVYSSLETCLQIAVHLFWRPTEPGMCDVGERRAAVPASTCGRDGLGAHRTQARARSILPCTPRHVLGACRLAYPVGHRFSRHDGDRGSWLAYPAARRLLASCTAG